MIQLAHADDLQRRQEGQDEVIDARFVNPNQHAVADAIRQLQTVRNLQRILVLKRRQLWNFLFSSLRSSLRRSVQLVGAVWQSQTV